MARDKAHDPQVQALVDRFVRMLPGQSFFVPEVTRLDMEFLRRPVTRLGCGIKMIQVEQDDIYLQPGVRIWREEGTYDEL